MAPPTSLIMHAPLVNGTTLKVGVGAAVFARSTTGTYIQSGILKTALVNESRFEVEGYLTEGARTNLVTHSEDFTSGNWTFNGTASAATDGTKAPDGATDAFLISWDNADSNDYIRSDVIPAFTGNISISFFYKAGTTNELRVRLFESGGIDGSFVLDTTDGSTTLVTTPVTDIIVTPLADGWNRLTAKVSGLTSSGGYELRLGSRSDGVTSPGNAYAFGVQTEEEEFPSSYIKTTGSSVTRAEDQLSYDAANWPTLDTEVSVGVTIASSNGDGTHIFRVFGTTIAIHIGLTSKFNWDYSGSSVSTTDATSDEIRVIGTWATGTNRVLYIDTVEEDSDSAADDGNSVISLQLGRFGPDTNNFFGHIKNLRIYSTKLTQEEVDDELVILNITVNQAIFDALTDLGFTGAVSEMQLQWLNSLGFTSGSINDRWKQLLDSQNIPDGGMAERQKQHYEAQAGVSGLGLNESKRAFWLSL